MKILIPCKSLKEIQVIEAVRTVAEVESDKTLQELLNDKDAFKELVERNGCGHFDLLGLCKNNNPSDEFVLYYLQMFMSEGMWKRISQVEDLPLNFIRDFGDFLYHAEVVKYNKNIDINYAIKKLSSYCGAERLCIVCSNKNFSDEDLVKFVRDGKFTEYVDEDSEESYSYCSPEIFDRVKRVLKLAYKSVDEIIDEVIV